MTARHEYAGLGWATDGLEDFEFRLAVPGAPFVQKNSRTPRIFPEGSKPGAKRGSYSCPYCKRRFHVILDATTAYKQWRKSAVEYLRDFWFARVKTGLPIWRDKNAKRRFEVNAAIVTYQKDRRIADADNLYAGPQDAMTEAGIFEDDVIVRTHDGSDRRYNKADPRVEITLTPWRERT